MPKPMSAWGQKKRAMGKKAKQRGSEHRRILAKTKRSRRTVRGIEDDELQEAIEAILLKQRSAVIDRLKKSLSESTNPRWIAGELIGEAYERQLIDEVEMSAARLAAGL